MGEKGCRYTFKEIVHVKKEYDPTRLLLVGDVGGTHCNFAIAEVAQRRVKLIISLHFLSNEITRFSDVVCWILKYVQEKYDIKVDKACFAGAGPVGLEPDVIRMTNLLWTIDVKNLKKYSSLKDIKIINDFEAIGYGIDVIDQKDIICIHEGECVKKKKHFNKAIIGAGTGLGKGVLVWNEQRTHYIPVSSEGGHVDFPAYNQEEFLLLKYIQDDVKKEESSPVELEDILSGKGISTIYKFLLKNRAFNSSMCTNEIAKSYYDASVIALHKKTDPCCQQTFEWFAGFYGRCAKNFALDVFALGGVYIVGGIAAKNPEIFREGLFLSEFFNNKKMKFFLKKISVYVVIDYNVSLYGAARSCCSV